MKLRDYISVGERRKAVERELKVTLTHTGSFSLNEKDASKGHCENMIGAVQIPVGIAGPLRLRLDQDLPSGREQSRDFYIPLATTEGALVASVARGCKAITAAGGASVQSFRTGASRGPVFAVTNLRENTRLYEFLKSHFEELCKITERTSRHLKLKKVTSRGVGLYRYVRFEYDTQDAMGLNMVTIATDAAARYIETETGATCQALSGNFCVDKKPAWQNFLNNRGFQVWAEVVLPESVLREVLKTDARTAYRTWYAKCMLGSAMSGSMGFNAQYANVVSALFIATGQDPAHTVEGSLGITTAEVIGGTDLYAGVYLPDLLVGTVGGGTGLATQKEALNILGVAGGDSGKNATRFARIAGAAILAGELSLLSSLGEGTLARAHRTLGRGEGK